MEENDVAALEEKLKEAEAAIQGIFKTGRIPTADDYYEIDQIKAKLKTARRVKTMKSRRTDPVKDTGLRINIDSKEHKRLSDNAAKVAMTLPNYIRYILCKHG